MRFLETASPLWLIPAAAFFMLLLAAGGSGVPAI